MPVVPGFSSNIRQFPQPVDDENEGDHEIIVQMVGDDEDQPEFDDSGAVIRINHGDGSVTVSTDGKPIEDPAHKSSNGKWFGNLVDKIDESELSRIADDLIRGIEADIESRRDWIDDRTEGIKLLGFKVEIPGINGATDGAPVEGISRVRHPLLQEAVLRFQANARSELLPTDGPVKVRNDDNNAYLEEDDLADKLEKDLNHYLTSTATEYYPDTDKMLMMLGFGGTAFKKVYFCPLRNRPVSETIDADDLIVNWSATDLGNAKRITHRIYMRQSVVRRMQLIGEWKDVKLQTPKPIDLNEVQREKLSQQGIKESTINPDDGDREIYECYCELNVKGFEHKKRGAPTELEIPYIVTIDLTSRQILAIVRNYDESTSEMPEARKRFVKYTFVPGLGFYDLGLLHILGNTTNAATAAWRIALDAGMYANFPGFIMSDAGGRQNTNLFRVPPGGGVMIKSGGLPLNQVIMPLPYKGVDGTFIGLVENMVETGMRVGGTSEAQVGEGRADAPVGTTLAMIDQATKVMNSVHKRMHSAQAEEFKLIVECFKENPESFWQRNRKPAYKWDEQTFLTALDNCDLVPQADPNTASHSQRVMKIMALKQLQAAQPTLYDPIAIDKAALKAIGWSNPEQFMASPEAQMRPPPEMQQAMAKMATDDKRANASMLNAQANMAKAQKPDAKASPAGPAGPDPQEQQTKIAELQLKASDQRLKAQQQNFQQKRAKVEDQNRDLDRESNMQMEHIKLAKEIIQQAAEQKHEHDMHISQSLAAAAENEAKRSFDEKNAKQLKPSKKES